MRKLPLGIQNFKEIVNGNYVYVDKTNYVYQLTKDAKYYFLSRPRRFGKSLLLDTIGAAFSGDKELFKGLFLYDTDFSFKEHPVLRLDMSNIGNKTPEILENELSIELKKRAKKEGFDIDYCMPAVIFKTLIEDLYNKYQQRVVVLIDEYDKPILDQLNNMKTAEANRQVLRGFYGILKSMDPFLRLTFITGVSKFTKTSIFSELNNLLDITLTKEYANICGITTLDLSKYFSDHINSMSSLEEFCHHDNLYDEILTWYDGYSWDGYTRVINPFSLLSFLIQKRFAGFWYASGTPKFLVELIKEKPSIYTNLKNLEITELMLDLADIEKTTVELMLFQTGYLTIKEVLKTGKAPIYVLDIPNFEVREAFNLHILSVMTENDNIRTGQAQIQIGRALKDGNLQKMLESLRSLFASIPYQLHIDQEAYYHSVFYAVMNVLGFNIDPEVSVSGGRIDAVLEVDDKVFIMEFKYEKCDASASRETKQKLFDKALDEGMRQIKDKGYAQKYTDSDKKVYLSAFAFLGRDNIEMRVEYL